MIAWIAPGSTVNETSDRALMAPKRTLTLSTSTAGMSDRVLSWAVRAAVTTSTARASCPTTARPFLVG